MKSVTASPHAHKNGAYQDSLTAKEWMKTGDVAVYLGTSQNNIRNMVYRGILFPKKFCNRWYFRRADIDYLIETEGG